jgi:hypothetical protein
MNFILKTFLIGSCMSLTPLLHAESDSKPHEVNPVVVVSEVPT